MKKPRWTPAETATARHLIDCGASDEQCIAAVGRNRKACWTRLDRERYNASVYFKPHPRVNPEPRSLEEATKRALAPRSITAFVFGDPAPGWSALDRREQRA